jgi:hypothetical protein
MLVTRRKANGYFTTRMEVYTIARRMAKERSKK